MNDPHTGRLLAVQSVAWATRLAGHTLTKRRAAHHHRIGRQISSTTEDLERGLSESQVDVGGAAR